MPDHNPTLQEKIRARRKQLRRECRALDIPARPCKCPQRAKACGCVGPCDCPGQTLADQFTPPCRCILQAEHDYGYDPDCDDDALNAGRQVLAWALLLATVFRPEHRDPPPPRRPGKRLARGGRVEKMAQRLRAGVHLYHEADAWRRDNREKYRVKTLVRRLRNGAMDAHEGLAAEDARAKAPEAKWPYTMAVVVNGETDRQRARIARENRVNQMLMQLGAAGAFDPAGRVDHGAIYGDRPTTPRFVAAGARQRRAA